MSSVQFTSPCMSKGILRSAVCAAFFVSLGSSMAAQDGSPVTKNELANGATVVPLDNADADALKGQTNPDEESAKPLRPQPTQVPVELQLERLGEGRVRFNFRDQSWRNALEWLADSSKMTLDWQTFPEGEFNLSTQQSYTLDEARDLFNMYLAARGFTLLRHGEVLSLVKLDKLNPILVPRVESQELDARDPHEMVRVSFPLDWLVAEEAVKELSPMLSPFGKLNALKATNRIEALDTVVNLKAVRALLTHEQSTQAQDRLIVEFKLKYSRADEVVEKLRALLGQTKTAPLLNADRGRNQGERNRNEEPGRNSNAEPQRLLPREAEVHLVISESENSVLVNAPADKVAIIREAITALDVPSSASSSANDTVTRMKIYRTKAIDPDALRDLIKGLVAGGKLQSDTQVQSDDNSHTLIVYATQRDHLSIANLISQIDDGREVRIIPIRRIDLDYALQSIKLLLQGGSSGGGSGGGGGRRQAAAAAEQFRIEVDYERKRLLLWASEAEFREITTLLGKLGEDSGRGENTSGIRVINLPAGRSEQTLESLRRVWPAVRNNPLRIHSRPPDANTRNLEPSSQPADRSEAPAGAQKYRVASRRIPRHFEFTQFTVDHSAQPAEANSKATPVEPNTAADANHASESVVPSVSTLQSDTSGILQKPIVITENPSGQVILSSQDPDALDAAENLLRQLLPQQAALEVYRLKHVSPLSLELSLRQIFRLDVPSSAAGGARLPTPRSTLQFVSDLDTATLLVQGATPEELERIEALIELYDQPETLDRDLQRKTEIYKLRYSRAAAVAEVVKEVYRDLLSASDKAFSETRRTSDSPSRDLGYGANYGSKIPKFKGLLSVGIEENSNSVVVSAPAYLIDDVLQLIRNVDRTASDHEAKVVRVNGIGVEQLRSVFAQMPGVTVTSGGSTTAGFPNSTSAPTVAPATAPQPSSAFLQRNEGNRRNFSRP
jgi:type II secretory pathway component GspD/PulD (secretin)